MEAKKMFHNLSFYACLPNTLAASEQAESPSNVLQMWQDWNLSCEIILIHHHSFLGSEVTDSWEIPSIGVSSVAVDKCKPRQIPQWHFPPPDPGKWYNTPDKMHYSQMNVTRFSSVACTGNETMQCEAEAPIECALWDIHASTTVYKILLSPSRAHTLVPQFKLLWYEILIQAKIGENMPN